MINLLHLILNVRVSWKRGNKSNFQRLNKLNQQLQEQLTALQSPLDHIFITILYDFILIRHLKHL